jgi:hypothetical protein
MPKPSRFSYVKKSPFRDSFFFLVVCEAKNREPEYFRFFEGISSRVQIVPVESQEGNSSPEKLISNALAKEKELEGFDPKAEQVWFVIDTDRWRDQIRDLRKACSTRKHWKVVQSNPCFEVWLYFHAKSGLPDVEKIDQCNTWKPLIPMVIKGGFNSDFHPIAIEVATNNARNAYQGVGDTPNPGSTQVWQLASALLPLIGAGIETLKDRFPAPEVIG